MLGAIAGDIIGSVYEQPSRNIKTKDFPLFRALSVPTDDSVLTCAVAQAFMDHLENPQQKLNDLLIDNLKSFGRSHRFVPYGERFRSWMDDLADRNPYNSWSNGSAMRVSSVGWLFASLDETIAMAQASAEVTHDHAEGIKGACAAAAAIYLARTGKSQDEICSYITENYYPLDFTIAEIRSSYIGSLSCSGSVPQAIRAFIDGTDFEDTIRNAVSIGGDSDTIAAIAGSIAEAYFGIPQSIQDQVLMILETETSDLLDVYRRFEKFAGACYPAIIQEKLEK